MSVRSPWSPSVSIVLATYNRSDRLPLAMDSLLEQDYPDLELLVMDDGSTDGTPELLREYGGRHPPERFRFERHDNIGQIRSINRGYGLAGASFWAISATTTCSLKVPLSGWSVSSVIGTLWRPTPATTSSMKRGL